MNIAKNDSNPEEGASYSILRGPIARESVLLSMMLSNLPAIGEPQFTYSREWRCFVLEYLRPELGEEIIREPQRLTFTRQVRFIPFRFDILGLLGYIALAVAIPVGLSLASATRARDAVIASIVLAATGLLGVAGRARIIRPDLRVLAETIKNERVRSPAHSK